MYRERSGQSRLTEEWEYGFLLWFLLDRPAKHYLRTFSEFKDIEGKCSLHLDWDSNPFSWITNGRFLTCEPPLTADPSSVDEFLGLEQIFDCAGTGSTAVLGCERHRFHFETSHSLIGNPYILSRNYADDNIIQNGRTHKWRIWRCSDCDALAHTSELCFSIPVAQGLGIGEGQTQVRLRLSTITVRENASVHTVSSKRDYFCGHVCCN